MCRWPGYVSCCPCLGLEQTGIIIAWLRLISVQKDGQTPLHAASSSGDVGIVEDLIAADAMVDAAAVRLQCWALLNLHPFGS